MRLNYADFLDIAVGGTVLGTGGGGSFVTAGHVLDHVLKGRTARVVSIKDLDPDAEVVAVAGMGSPEAMLEKPFTTEAVAAYDALARDLGRRPKYVIALETSGFNFLTALSVAALRSAAIVDADPAGRAIPKLDQTLYHAHGYRLAPMALADARGKNIVIRSADFDLAESAAIAALGRFGWSAGVACYPLSGARVRRAAVPGTLTLARKVGTAIRNAGRSGADVVSAALAAAGGEVIIRGTVTAFESESVGSYKFGTLSIEGNGPDAGSTAVVKSMNENMIAWKNGNVAAVAPDRICFMAPKGPPITNAEIKESDEIVVFVIAAQRQWRRKAASGLFAPVLRAMGFQNL